MSIKSELTKTASYLRSARNAIAGRGGEISATAGLKDLPMAIFNIPADSSLGFYSDDTVAYKKTTLANAKEKILLNEIGGMTYKSNQLLPTGYWDSASKSGTYGGMAFTNHGDGSFTFNGTCEGASIELFTVSLDNYPENFKKYSLYGDYLSFGATLPEGVECYLYLDGGDDTGSGVPLTGSGGLTGASVNWRIASIYLSIPSGTVFNKLTIKPMLNLGTTALPYEPYFEGLRDSKVTALKVYGANLLRYPYYHSTITSNGVTFTDNGDGTVTANGTATARALFRCRLSSDFTLPKGAYTLSGCPSGGSTSTYYLQCEFYNKSTWVMGIVDTGASATKDASNKVYTGVSCDIVILQGTVCNNLLFKPMINLGTKAASQYLPYKAEPTTYALPEAVQNLPLFGEGVTDSSTKITYANTVDLENKQYSNYLPKKVVFDGVNVKANTVDKTGVYRALYTLPKTTPSARALNITHFNVNYANKAGNAYLYSNSLIMCPINQSLNTLDKFNAWLKEMYDKGTPVEAVYAMTTPEITDISKELAGFDPFIYVEPTGEIEFVNEHENAVPSTITYIVKAGS